MKATALPFTVPVIGIAPRGLSMLPVSASPACVATSFMSRAPIGVSTLNVQLPLMLVAGAAGFAAAAFAVAGAAAGAAACCGVVAHAASADAAAATRTKESLFMTDYL